MGDGATTMTRDDGTATTEPLSPMQVFLRRVPPFSVIPHFLGADRVAMLLEYAMAYESRFTDTKIGEGETRRVDSSTRVSQRLREIGPWRSEIEARMLALLPAAALTLGVTPFAPAAAELELVAHGDGAFYKAHVDPRRRSATNQRMISAVYYFNAAPKAFTGGALRLLAFEGDAFVDIEPENDTLAIFPSWALHEVLPVSCPSRRFIDSRFAINCWLLRNPDPKALRASSD
jgi:Rps23 Pro-64 3,4-dihydroxylase Tpa1-like proline 4-hydroxylase